MDERDKSGPDRLDWPPGSNASGMSRTRKVHVKSFGCQMNVYDSHRMADTLAPAGYSETARIEDADLVILNTCNIREKAVDKLYSEIGRIRELKEEAAALGRSMLIAVAGCVAQAEGKEIVRRASTVDLVVAEVGRLADAGGREVTLVGQNVNAYHGQDAHGRPATLGRLLRCLDEVPG